MATAPVKSKPLHNFSLPLLKWGHKNQINTNHRYRRPSETAEHRRSPPSEQDSVGGGGSRNDSDSENRNLVAGSRNRFSFARPREKEKVIEVRDEVEGEESVAKPWNLRPRKAVAKAAVEIGRVSKNGEVLEPPLTVREITELPSAENLPKSTRLRGFAEGHGSEKRRFWIALSREEIEEDVYAMTGSKPARRPKKRPKNIQKQLDNVFPGLYLAGITADCYRVQDDPIVGSLEVNLSFLEETSGEPVILSPMKMFSGKTTLDHHLIVVIEHFDLSLLASNGLE
ncbi:hypothetical protein Acr_15g0005810 [Actinidia rufa]|uniref:Uncharacterized protein n=1 Tax=Actinidia rufa TaxID=165716 RepID=A0A7J0FTE2_9ERIC|nr:hypothetical protein Acr_15g0005810 [Actinidia rufa]